MHKTVLLLTLVLTAAPVLAQDRAEVLVLGTYHMANPGHDIFSTKVDDVLAPKRQAEIAQLVEVLKKFNPTKIAIESDVYSKKRPGEYADYVAGRHQLTSNEIEQIGFRLAKELGHRTIYPIDVDGDFPFQRVVDYAKASGRTKEFDVLMSESAARAKEENDYILSHTVLDSLLHINSDDVIARDAAFYPRCAHFGEPGDWAGADLLAGWYQRNARIYSNIARLVESPGDRILVVYGSGHLSWLRYDVANDPALKLRKLADFVR